MRGINSKALWIKVLYKCNPFTHRQDVTPEPLKPRSFILPHLLKNKSVYITYRMQTHTDRCVVHTVFLSLSGGIGGFSLTQSKVLPLSASLPTMGCYGGISTASERLQ